MPPAPAALYRFGDRSRSNLAECHPDLQLLFLTVIRSRDCAVIEGSRSKAEQDRAVAAGTSRARWPASNHNVDGTKRRTAWAADVVPYPVDWNDRARFEAFATFVLSTAAQLREIGVMRHEVRNGGDWDRDGVFDDWDMPHFELIGVPDGE